MTMTMTMTISWLRWILVGIYLSASIDLVLPVTTAPPKTDLILEIKVQRTGNDVTATWKPLPSGVSNAEIRVCELESCSTNPRSIPATDPESEKVEFTVEGGKIFIYSFAVQYGGRLYVSKPVQAEIHEALGLGPTLTIVISVVVVVALVILVIILICCLRHRFKKIQGQYAFTEMNKKERKKYEKKAMNEITSSSDLNGVLHINDNNAYTILDDNVHIHNNGDARRDVSVDMEVSPDAGDDAVDVRGKLEIDTRPDVRLQKIDRIDGNISDEENPNRLRPKKLLSMGVSLESEDDLTDEEPESPKNKFGTAAVNLDEGKPDIGIVQEAAPVVETANAVESLPGATASKPKLVHTFSFESDDEDNDEHNDVTVPDIALNDNLPRVDFTDTNIAMDNTADDFEVFEHEIDSAEGFENSKDEIKLDIEPAPANIQVDMSSNEQYQDVILPDIAVHNNSAVDLPNSNINIENLNTNFEQETKDSESVGDNTSFNITSDRTLSDVDSAAEVAKASSDIDSNRRSSTSSSSSSSSSSSTISSSSGNQDGELTSSGFNLPDIIDTPPQFEPNNEQYVRSSVDEDVKEAEDVELNAHSNVSDVLGGSVEVFKPDVDLLPEKEAEHVPEIDLDAMEADTALDEEAHNPQI